MLETVATKTYCNPLGIQVADPNVFYHEGTYYLYGTDEKRKAGDGNCVYTSTDMVNWTEHDLAFKKTGSTWCQSNFWGAEVIKKDAKFLMYYCCSPNKTSKLPLNMHLAAAIGDSPLGPFAEIRAPLYSAPKEKEEVIDQNIFVDDDGQAYLFYVLVVLGSHNEIRVLKLKDNYLDIDGEPVACIYPDLEWESNQWEGHKVAEAPFAFKHNGHYYLLYTCNHFLDDRYAIGYATAEHPRDPWKKFEGNPILQMNDKVRGPGNASLIKSPDGKQTYIIYHTHNKSGKVAPRLISIDKVNFIPQPNGNPDTICINGPTTTPQPYPSGI